MEETRSILVVRQIDMQNWEGICSKYDVRVTGPTAERTTSILIQEVEAAELGDESYQVDTNLKYLTERAKYINHFFDSLSPELPDDLARDLILAIFGQNQTRS